MSEAIGHFFVNNWFSIFAAVGAVLGAYYGAREKFSDLDNRVGIIEKSITKIGLQLATDSEKISGLSTFQAVQMEKNVNQDKRFDELVNWLRSIDKKLDSLITGKRTE